jgi:superfamily II DNA or RNA helicase
VHLGRGPLLEGERDEERGGGGRLDCRVVAVGQEARGARGLEQDGVIAPEGEADRRHPHGAAAALGVGDAGAAPGHAGGEAGAAEHAGGARRAMVVGREAPVDEARGDRGHAGEVDGASIDQALGDGDRHLGVVAEGAGRVPRAEDRRARRPARVVERHEIIEAAGAEGFQDLGPGPELGRITEGVAHREADHRAGEGRGPVGGPAASGKRQARARLPALLEALRAGQELVPLGDGTYGLIPEEWLERLGLLARVARGKGEALRFPRAQGALLDALIAREPEVRVDARFAELRRRLASHAQVRPRRAPRGFHGKLRGYQEQGLGWLRFLEDLGLGGCLADDMGLGKTVQVLAHLLGRRRSGAGRPSLVVAPRTLLFNWQAEAARFAPGLRVHVHHGGGRAERRDQLERADLVLTTYGTLARDAAMFSEIELEYAVLDEAQAMKNAGSQTARACRALVARHRLALSGTPIENRLSDLGSIMEFLNPGMIDASSVLAPLTSDSAGEAGLELLARALRPFLLRRTKEEVLTELPPKVEQTVACELQGKQRKLYQELRDHYRTSLMGRVERQGLARSKIHVLEALLRLRQAACHPGLIDRDRSDDSSAKLDALIERIAEVVAGGHKALAFSQFTSFLALVRRRLEQLGIAYEYLDGKTRDRGARVARFQTDPDCRVFLLSLKAGGHGLNLTAADYVFLLDPWWNPAVEAQAVDRAHRIGQDKRVFTYRLVARDTVEEKVLALQADKRRLAEAVVRRDASLLGRMSVRDLELLLA